jgi:hypothetical protein
MITEHKLHEATDKRIWTCDRCRLEGSYYRMVEHVCLDEQDDSILAVRLHNARQAAADLAERLNRLHSEACSEEPYLAMLLLPVLGDANGIERKLAQLLEVRK